MDGAFANGTLAERRAGMRVATRPSPALFARRISRRTLRRARRGFRAPPSANLVDVASDSGVALVSYVASDLIAQFGEARRPLCAVEDEVCLLALSATDEEPSTSSDVNVERLRRYAAFGALDGVISHFWYGWLDEQSLSGAWPPLPGVPEASGRVAEMVAADIICFSPWWCALFLASMTAMNHLGDPARVEGLVPAVRRRLRDQWSTLYFGDMLLWIPLNGILYGLVPVERRVQAFGFMNLTYTAVLSWWAERTRNAARRSSE